MTTSMAFYGGANTGVRLNEYDAKRPPILTLDDDGAWLSISAFESVPIADHLDFARSLASAAAEYVTALETYAASLPDAADRGR